MRKILIKLLPVLMAIGILVPVATPVAAADVPRMIEVRGLTYSDFVVDTIGSGCLKKCPEGFVSNTWPGAGSVLILTATGTGTLHIESRPDLNAKLLLRQAFRFEVDHNSHGISYLSGMTFGEAEIIVFDDTGETEKVFGPVAFSGAYYRSRINPDDDWTDGIQVDAATKNGARIALALSIVVDRTAAGLKVDDLFGSGYFLGFNRDEWNKYDCPIC